mgnify:CR=1 FL=1|jgi:hypothetical protein
MLEFWEFNLNINMQVDIPFVQPKIIQSPYTGEYMKPRLRTYDDTFKNKRYTEAQWWCPSSGQFVKKGIVSVEDINSPE